MKIQKVLAVILTAATVGCFSTTTHGVDNWGRNVNIRVINNLSHGERERHSNHQVLVMMGPTMDRLSGTVFPGYDLQGVSMSIGAAVLDPAQLGHALPPRPYCFRVPLYILHSYTVAGMPARIQNVWPLGEITDSTINILPLLTNEDGVMATIAVVDNPEGSIEITITIDPAPAE